VFVQHSFYRTENVSVRESIRNNVKLTKPFLCRVKIGCFLK